MKFIRIEKLPKRKREAICVYDTEANTSYVIGYINNYKNLFIEALTNCKYVKEN